VLALPLPVRLMYGYDALQDAAQPQYFRAPQDGKINDRPVPGTAGLAVASDKPAQGTFSAPSYSEKLCHINLLAQNNG
jgi:hypothetical protein